MDEAYLSFYGHDPVNFMTVSVEVAGVYNWVTARITVSSINCFEGNFLVKTKSNSQHH